jgi:hypothetical protein
MAKMWDDEEARRFIFDHQNVLVLWRRDYPGYGKRGPQDKATSAVACCDELL